MNLRQHSSPQIGAKRCRRLIQTEHELNAPPGLRLNPVARLRLRTEVDAEAALIIEGDVLVVVAETLRRIPEKLKVPVVHRDAPEPRLERAATHCVLERR